MSPCFEKELGEKDLLPSKSWRCREEILAFYQQFAAG